MFDAFHAVANNAADIFQNPFTQVHEWVQAPFAAVKQAFQAQPGGQTPTIALSSF